MRLFSVLTFFIAGGLGLAYATYLARYRVDLKPGRSPMAGRSFYSGVNLLSPGNYDVTGRRKLRWVYAAMIVQLMSGVAWVFTF